MPLSAVEPDGDEKRRAVLTDAEFQQLFACPAVLPELKMMVLLARTIGGMRTGDLHALEWRAFGPDFATAIVPRRKTRKKRPAQELEVPAAVRGFIDAWWRALGEPKCGPVFPVRRGKRTGKRKRPSNSYAKQLREALLVAGVRRHECTRPVDAVPRKRGEPCCENMAGDPLYSETDDTLPVDFHSTRRAYCTALARANVVTSVAQVLAGHSDGKVHQGYVAAETIRALPPEAMPTLPSAAPMGGVRQRRCLTPDLPAQALDGNLSDCVAPAAGLEPATRWLTATCSTD